MERFSAASEKASRNNTDYTDKKRGHGLHGKGFVRCAQSQIVLRSQPASTRWHLAEAEMVRRVRELFLDADHLGHAGAATAQAKQLFDRGSVAGHQCFHRTVEPIAHP